jgi:hypothetical protein
MIVNVRGRSGVVRRRVMAFIYSTKTAHKYHVQHKDKTDSPCLYNLCLVRITKRNRET